jgi:DUF1680 family protein
MPIHQRRNFLGCIAGATLAVAWGGCSPGGGETSATSGAAGPDGSVVTSASSTQSTGATTSGNGETSSASGASSTGGASGTSSTSSLANSTASSTASNETDGGTLALDAGDGVIETTAAPFTMIDASYVKLLSGSPFYDRQQLHRTGYVASFKPDVMLWGFRNLAKLPQAAGVTGPMAGWDSTQLKGHMTGHYLSAASRLFAATGDTTFATKVNYMVTELGKVQDALDGGYLAAFAVNDPAVAAPYYVHHKVLQGLVDAYKYVGNQQAMAIALKFSTYFTNTLASTSYAGDSELGGMTDVLTEIYQITGNQAPLKLAPKFEPTSFITPLAADQDQLNGQHGNMHIAFLQGGARYANVTGDATETAASKNFWSIVTQHHSYVHGGDTVHEWFDAPNVEASNLPYSTGEACNSHNMLKITARLVEREQSPAEGDYFERTLFNHSLASIAPDTGYPTYFMPLRGEFRDYINSTYCCTGTGIESTGRYNEGIYYKGKGVLMVNLYIPSVVTWPEQGLVIQQQGFLPVTDTATFTVTTAVQPVAATIQFRIPGWVMGTVRLTINGQAQTTNVTPSSYLPVNRTWKLGDVVTLTLPPGLRIEHAKDQSSMVAIFYGPVLMAGELGTANMPNDTTDDNEAFKTTAAVNVPNIVSSSTSPADWLTETDATSLAFKANSSVGPAAGIVFQPLYAVHHQRYSVYWQLGQ